MAFATETRPIPMGLPVIASVIAGVTALSLMVAAPVFAQSAQGPQGPQPGQGPQQAQGQGQQQGQGEQGEAPKIPAAVLSGLLTGTPEALLALKQYLAAVSKSSEEVSRRAVDVISQLRSSGLVRDPAVILAAAERVTQAVGETLSATKIVKLKVDRNYQPRAGTIALDFAPADAKARPGFRKVLLGDPMLKGEDMQAIRRPGEEDDVLGDGMVGVESINLDVPDGEYNVTLMTESIGDAQLSLSPFGQQITANGQVVNVGQATPENWLNQAVLSRQGLDGLQNTSSRQGGAITLKVRVINGKLQLDFNFGSAANSLKTYLTGMLIEPADEPSDFAAPEEITRLLNERPDVGQYETQVASNISTLLEQAVEPEAGPEEDDLAEPVQTVQQASPS